jgi:hypothetical protein
MKIGSSCVLPRSHDKKAEEILQIIQTEGFVLVYIYESSYTSRVARVFISFFRALYVLDFECSSVLEHYLTRPISLSLRPD